MNNSYDQLVDEKAVFAKSLALDGVKTNTAYKPSMDYPDGEVVVWKSPHDHTLQSIF